MTNRTTNHANTQPSGIPQYRLGQIILMFAWPAVWFAFLVYTAGPLFAPTGGSVPTWAYLTVSIMGNGAELIAALVILRREGYPLSLRSPALRERINWRLPNTGKKWAAVAVVFVAVFLGTVVLGSLIPHIARLVD